MLLSYKTVGKCSASCWKGAAGGAANSLERCFSHSVQSRNQSLGAESLVASLFDMVAFPVENKWCKVLPPVIQEYEKSTASEMGFRRTWKFRPLVEIQTRYLHVVQSWLTWRQADLFIAH